MTSIGNQISFNNRSYDVDKTNNGQNQTTVRENFAQKLNEFSADNNISADEKAQLETLSSTGTAAEKAIVATISKAGTAAFDPDASASMPPVQVSFGNPGSAPAPTAQAPQASAPPATVNNQRTPENGEIKVRVGGQYGSDEMVSRRMAGFLDEATNSNRGIGYREFERLATIASETGTPGDLKVVSALADLAITQSDDRNARSSIVIGDNQNPRQIRINDTPPPEGRGGIAGSGFRGFISNLLTTTVPNIATQWVDSTLRDAVGLNSPATTNSGTTTGGKTETTTTNPTPTPDIIKK